MLLFHRSTTKSGNRQKKFCDRLGIFHALFLSMKEPPNVVAFRSKNQVDLGQARKVNTNFSITRTQLQSRPDPPTKSKPY